MRRCGSVFAVLRAQAVGATSRPNRALPGSVRALSGLSTENVNPEAARKALAEKFPTPKKYKDESPFPPMEAGDKLTLKQDKSNTFTDGSKTWRLNAAVVVERLHSVEPDAEPWQVEHELKQFELRQRFSKSFPEGWQREDDIKEDNEGDLGEEGKKPFEPAPVRTAADEANDRKSLDRALEERLYLIVKKDRATHGWQFPQLAWSEGETIRTTAEKAVLELAGGVQATVNMELREAARRKKILQADKVEVVDEVLSPEQARIKKLSENASMQVFVVGNGPCGAMEYAYPADHKAKTKADGAKTFFFRVRHLEGDATVAKPCVDHLWVTKSELAEYLDAKTYQYVRCFLWDP